LEKRIGIGDDCPFFGGYDTACNIARYPFCYIQNPINDDLTLIYRDFSFFHNLLYLAGILRRRDLKPHF
jgi:hypothetical protein